MTEFIMVRHGEPDYSIVNEWAKIDVAKNFAPLTETGIAQINETILYLQEENADIIITSPFTRCMQGACMMSKALNLDVFVEHDLHEWELDTTHSVRQKHAIKRLLWQFKNKNWTPKSKWENPDAVKKRILKTLNKYLKYDKVIVSCHAMVILYTLGDEEPTQYGKIRRFCYDGKQIKESTAYEN